MRSGWSSLCWAVLCTAPVVGLAEPPLFPSGFVTELGRNMGRDVELGADGTAPSIKAGQQMEGSVPSAPSIGPASMEGPAPSGPSASPAPDAGLAITHLGAVLPNDTAAHAQTALAELLRTAHDRKLKLSRVYLLSRSICTTITRARTQIRQLAKLGGLLYCVSQLPGELVQVKVAPTWLLGTANGQVVLEGFKDPERYLNKRSEFVPPSSALEGA